MVLTHTKETHPGTRSYRADYTVTQVTHSHERDRSSVTGSRRIAYFIAEMKEVDEEVAPVGCPSRCRHWQRSAVPADGLEDNVGPQDAHQPVGSSRGGRVGSNVAGKGHGREAVGGRCGKGRLDAAVEPCGAKVVGTHELAVVGVEALPPEDGNSRKGAVGAARKDLDEEEGARDVLPEVDVPDVSARGLGGR